MHKVITLQAESHQLDESVNSKVEEMEEEGWKLVDMKVGLTPDVECDWELPWADCHLIFKQKEESKDIEELAEDIQRKTRLIYENSSSQKVKRKARETAFNLNFLADPEGVWELNKGGEK